jgi:hypothetical protein
MTDGMKAPEERDPVERTVLRVLREIRNHHGQRQLDDERQAPRGLH